MPNHVVKPKTGRLELKTYPAEITITEVVRYMVENPLWAIGSATVSAAGIIVGAVISGAWGAAVSAVLVLVGSYFASKARIIKEVHRPQK